MEGGEFLGPVHLAAWQADTHIMHIGVSTCILYIYTCWSTHTNITQTQVHSLHYAWINACMLLHTHTHKHRHMHTNTFAWTHLFFPHLNSCNVCKLNICFMQRWRRGQPVWLWAESPCGLPQPPPLAYVTGPAHAVSLLPPLLFSPSSHCLPPGPGINRWVMPAVLPWGVCWGAQ